MGSVICTYKVMPKDTKDFGKIRKALEALKPERIVEEPVAFGIKALKVTFMIPDSSGAIEKLENSLESIKGATYEELSVTRSL